MKLMLAEKKTFGQTLKRVGLAITAPLWLQPKALWVLYWNNIPAAEKDRYAATLAEVKNSLNQSAGRNLFLTMNFENAEYLLNNLPSLIQEANNKFALTPTSKVGEKRVITRYLKAFNQILDEVYIWGVQNTPPDLQSQLVPPSTIKDTQPPALVTQPSFPTAPTLQPWYKNPIYIIGGAAAAFFLLPKLLKR